MPAFSGISGSVVLVQGGTALVEGIGEWTIDIAHSPIDATEFGQEWDSFVPTTRNYTGSFAGNKQTTGTASLIQSALLGGSAVALRLFENGTKYYNVGTAFLTGESINVGVKGKGEVTFNFQGSGPITYV